MIVALHQVLDKLRYFEHNEGIREIAASLIQIVWTKAELAPAEILAKDE